MISLAPSVTSRPARRQADPMPAEGTDAQAGPPPTDRVGFGFDTHPFAEDRPLYLGGVRFDGVPGLAGHSDGDAVCHAVADALLGSVAAGDVGEHFPDTDPAIAGIAGPDLLTRTVELVRARGVRPVRCDVTILAERPAIAPRRAEIRSALAAALGVGVGAVSVKATRPEGLGLTGAGIGCMALVTVTALSPP
jgi:2-C-methyl-D-erythritol 2,4-cyclodiphosphate synthase